MQSKKLSNNLLISYQSVVIKLLELKREVRWIRNPKNLGIVRTVTLLRKQFIYQNCKAPSKRSKKPSMGQYLLEITKKSYKHMIKVSKRQWEIKNIQKLSELTEDPKLFWSHLKSLRGATKSSTSNVIPPQKWVEQFVIFWNWKERGPRGPSFSIWWYW